MSELSRRLNGLDSEDGLWGGGRSLASSLVFALVGYAEHSCVEGVKASCPHLCLEFPSPFPPVRIPSYP